MATATSGAENSRSLSSAGVVETGALREARRLDEPTQKGTEAGEHGAQDVKVEGDDKSANVRDEGRAGGEGEEKGGASGAPSDVEDPDSKPIDNQEAERSLLLELVRGFRGEMLRVDSSIRAEMFRAIRYLVRASASAESLSCVI